jgi:HlyD family secretion protein
MAKPKLLIPVALAAAVLVTGAWAYLSGTGGTQFRAAPVTRGMVASTISATGAPNAVVTVQVGSQVSGNILALYADFNTRVKKGQVVARIDPEIYQARVDQASATLNAAQSAVVNTQAQIEKNKADVSSAQAAVSNAKANVAKAQSAVTDAKNKLDRRMVLVNQGIMSKEDGETAQATYEQAVAELDAANAAVVAAQDNVNAAQAEVRVGETQLSSAQANVRQAQAALVQAQADLAHTYILAPVDGVVVSRNIDVGQTVAASLQAPTLFQIAEDLTKMQVDTNVAEADVGRVKVGMPATFTVDAYPGTTFRGTVSSIRQAPINVQNVVTYDVVISVANPDLKLFPGMTANVRILVDQHSDVLRVPNAALRFRPAEAAAPGKGGRGKGSQVWVLDASGKPQVITVTLGITDGTYTEIRGDGLKEGDRVITAALAAKGQTAQTTTSASPFGEAGGGGGARRGGF